ncbi:MAG: hypothetical protein LC679_10365 [Intrasporangiaceae bacterium]|nr:hypothetical protein [Intrasporangiaceae bacterium]
MRWLWIIVLLTSAVVVGSVLSAGDVIRAVGYGALGVAVAWWLSPRQGGRSARHDEVMERAESEREVVIYWRPGCVFCARLRGRLGRAGRKATWVNIWQDEAGARLSHGDTLTISVDRQRVLMNQVGDDGR